MTAVIVIAVIVVIFITGIVSAVVAVCRMDGESRRLLLLVLFGTWGRTEREIERFIKKGW